MKKKINLVALTQDDKLKKITQSKLNTSSHELCKGLP